MYINFTEFMYMFFQIFRKSLKFHQYKVHGEYM